MVGPPIGEHHLIMASKEADSDDTPNTIPQVKRRGIDRIVNLELDKQASKEEEDGPTNETNDDRGPSGDNGATTRDGHKTSKSSVGSLAQIPV